MTCKIIFSGSIEEYVKSLGRDKVLELIRGQLDDIDFVEKDVYEDNEGLSYNSIRFKKKAKDSKKKSICDICGQEVKDIEKIGQHFCVCPECKRHMKESDIELLK